MNKTKENQESKLQVLKVIKRLINQDGEEVMKTRWEEANGEVNLGSCAKPNKDILEFRYDIPKDKPEWFKGVFGK